jgi:hypothetical protein
MAVSVNKLRFWRFLPDFRIALGFPLGQSPVRLRPVAPAGEDRGFLCTLPCRKESTITVRAQGPAWIAVVFPSRDTPETINCKTDGSYLALATHDHGGDVIRVRPGPCVRPV